MTTTRPSFAALPLLLSSALAAASGSHDPRLREVMYDPNGVVTLPVKRGVVTLVVLGADETITEVGAGLSADCAKADAAWCVAAQPGGRTLFVKPKSTARAANTLAVVTDRRNHTLRLVVLDDDDRREPIYRLTVKAPVPVAFAARPMPPVNLQLPPLPVVPLPPPPEQLVAERLKAKPQVVNTRYSVADGHGSDDIVPTLVFDDGRFTYLRFPANREVPAVFHVLGDGQETLVNTRMEEDLLVVDRVSRRLVLRAGAAVVGVWNDAFDLEGLPPGHGTTVPGVERLLKSGQSAAAATTKAGRP